MPVHGVVAAPADPPQRNQVLYIGDEAHVGVAGEIADWQAANGAHMRLELTRRGDYAVRARIMWPGTRPQSVPSRREDPFYLRVFSPGD